MESSRLTTPQNMIHMAHTYLYMQVCNECKSSHQAISHRCKSLTMSSWTAGEVLQLQQQGGNDRARATWLAHAPPYGHGGRPCAGTSDLAVYKRFVVEAYEHKKYYGSSTNDVDANHATTPAATATIAAAVVPQQSQPRVAAPRQTAVAKPTPTAPVAAPVTDLLDFGAFEAVPSPVSNEGVSLFDPFQQQQSQSSPAPPAVVAAPPSSFTTTDLFTVAPAATDPFGGFDPFAATASTAAATTTTSKLPVMRNNNTNTGSTVMNQSTISTGMPNQLNGMAPMGRGMSSCNNNNNAFLGMPMNATSTGNSLHSQGFGFVSQPQQSQFMPTTQNTPMGMTMGFHHSNMGMMNGTTMNGFGNFNAGSSMGANNNSNSMMMTMMSMPTSGFPNAVGGISHGLNPGFQYGGDSAVPPQPRQSSSYTSHSFTGAAAKPDPFAGLGL